MRSIFTTLFKPQNRPRLALVLTLVWMVVQLRYVQGRVWFCDCWSMLFWVPDSDGPHTSQHLSDPYTFTHVEHGLILCWVAMWLVPRWKWPWQVYLCMLVEALWEVIENTQIVIDRYRTATAALGYTGDSVLNSLGDVLACYLGILAAKKLGWNASWVLLIAIEVVLLITIRDNLLLNVVMLFFPLEAIKAWQTG